MTHSDGRSRPNPVAPPGTFVVIAAYNEASMIGDVVAGLLPTCPNVVVVDDGSIDATRDAASQAGATALRHAINRGQGAALQTGICYALDQGADYLVTFDADGQHRPEDIPALLKPLVAGAADFALGSRFLGSTEKMPTLRKLTLKAAVIFTRATAGVRVTDAHNGLRAMTRRGAEALDIRLDRMAHASEIVDQVRRSALPWVEVPVTVRYSRYSLAKGQKSTTSISIAVDYVLSRLLN